MRYVLVVVLGLTVHAHSNEAIAANNEAAGELHLALFDQLEPNDEMRSGQLNFTPSGRIPPDISVDRGDSAGPSSSQRNFTLWKRSAFNTALGMSRRTGNLSWSIASDMSGKRAPNVLSELSYEGLEIRGFEVQSSVSFFGGLLDDSFLDVRLHRGVITGGETRDSDYDGDNKTQEYSRSLSVNTGDFVADYSVAYGFNILNKQGVSASALAGYSLHQQYVRKQNAVKVAPDTDLVLGDAIEGLNSTYQSQWQGPWLGTSVSLHGNKHRLKLQGEIHSALYYAEADWNLRDSFKHPKSFEHNASGLGWVVDVSYAYTFDFSQGNKTTLGLSYRAEEWATEEGVDTLYLASGEVVSTRLNEVAWGGSAVSIQLKILR